MLVAVFAPLIVPYPADAGSATHPEMALQAPSMQHLFGTDQVGRDVFSRVLEGTRVSPVVAVFVLLIACLVGIPLGVLAGYFGGVADEGIMRITDIFLAFPPLLLALAFATALPANLTSLTIAIAITWWPWYTRLVRGQAASVAGRPYVEACRALGIPSWRILLRHVLPNSVTPVIVQVSLDVGGVILTASALSFLGLGAQDPTPDWGLMVAEGPELLHHPVVAGDVPRPGHPAHRARVQPARRRPARRARPAKGASSGEQGEPGEAGDP